MATVKLSTQGFQRSVGSIKATDVPVGKTPFQRLQAPLLDGGAGTLMKVGEMGIAAAKSMAAFNAQTQADEARANQILWDGKMKAISDADKLEWSRAQDVVETGGETEIDNDGAVITKSNPVSVTAPNPKAALGLHATEAWQQDRQSFFDQEAAKITNSEGYKNLNAAQKNATDQMLSIRRNAFVSELALHRSEQMKVARTAAEDVAITNASADVSIATGDTLAARLVGLAGKVENKASGSGQDFTVVNSAYQKAAGEAVATNIANIAKDSGPDKAARMQAVLQQAQRPVTLGGQEVSPLTPAALSAMKETVALQTSGEANRARGTALFEKYPNSLSEAMAALRKQQGLSDADYDAILAEYKAQVGAMDADKKRHLDSVEEGAQRQIANGNRLEPASIAALPPERQEALHKASRYALKRKQNGADRITVTAIRHKWLLLSDADKAAISPDAIYDSWLPHMGREDGNEERMITEYNAARKAVGKTGLAAQKYAQKLKTAAQKASNQYFSTQLKNAVASLKEGQKVKDSTAGLIQYALEREFAQRNVEGGMKNDDVDKLITEVTSSVLLKANTFSDDDALLGTMLADFTTADGTPVKGSAELVDAIKAIPAGDRFEYIRFFRAHTGAVPNEEGQLDANGFASFLSLWGPKGTATIKNVPAPQRTAIKAHNSALTDAQVVQTYIDLSLIKARK